MRVDRESGYRFYAGEQIEQARLVAQLRRLDMPLTTVKQIVALDGPAAAESLAEWWHGVETASAERRVLAAYLQRWLRGEDHTVPDIQRRSMPERRILSISRYLYGRETDAFFDDAFARLRAAAPGLPGVEGAPFLIFYGEVSDDSDGPMELCRPVCAEPAVTVAGDMQLRIEPPHDEVYIPLAMADMGWPAMLPAFESLHRWVSEQGLRPAGAARQVLIADQRAATPDTLVCDLSVPLR